MPKTRRSGRIEKKAPELLARAPMAPLRQSAATSLNPLLFDHRNGLLCLKTLKLASRLGRFPFWKLPRVHDALSVHA
jgi:hypothetical protein